MIKSIVLLSFAIVVAQCVVNQHLWLARERVQKAIDLDIEQSVRAKELEVEMREEKMGLPLAQRTMRRTYREYYLRQRMDHFDYKFTVSNTELDSGIWGTYLQRYWANFDHCRDRSSCPVFLYIGGEGSESSWRVRGGHHVEMAAQHGAIIFAVEHRFYGKSINPNGLKLKQLRHLNSQQALADLAHFHEYASKKYHLTEKNPWISFGGSYPGMMSAWFRIKYPHLVIAAVASSPPIHSEVEFHGYHNTISNDLGKEIVGGSKQCKDAVEAAFKTIDDMFRAHKHVEVGKMFKSCNPIGNGRYDVDNFASSLAGIFDGVIQYNNEVAGAENVESLCRTMLSTSDPLKNLIRINDAAMAKWRQSCADYSYQGLLDYIKNERVNPKQYFGLRQWIYQTCTQFGYFQGCNATTDCVFSKYNTIEPMLDICEKVYNIPRKDIYEAVKFSNKYYGDNKPKGTKIVYVNGSIDPWHSISVLKDLDESQKAIFIQGTSHCHNMVRSLPTDPAYLTKARHEIEDLVSKWLREHREGTDDDDDDDKM